MRPHLDRAARIRTTALLAAALAAGALVVAPATSAQAGGAIIYCSTDTYNGRGEVVCTEDSIQYFQYWSETGATGVYENTPVELAFYCTAGSPVSAILHTTIGSPAWYGTCA